MKKFIPFLVSFALIALCPVLDAQKTYKAVCDRSDGTVKIVDGEDRSPNLVPLKGGFPFYQVAQNWVKENYPNGKCDPAASAQQNKAAADAVTRASATGQTQPATSQARQPADLDASFNATAGSAPAAAPALRYRNTSMFISLLFSNLGKVYSLDPPLIPGLGAGVEQLFGKKLYGGTGIHLNALAGKTDDAAGVSSFYSLRVPLFAGYRQLSGSYLWGVDLGLAANTMLRPVTAESHLAGEIAADYSLNTITRVRFGIGDIAFEFGVDVWLNDILASEEGFQMTVLSAACRYSF
jgi:hypothetical protein